MLSYRVRVSVVYVLSFLCFVHFNHHYRLHSYHIRIPNCIICQLHNLPININSDESLGRDETYVCKASHIIIYCQILPLFCSRFCSCLIDNGIAFHSLGAAAAKARSPRVGNVRKLSVERSILLFDLSP